MSGDAIQMAVKSFYKTGTNTTQNGSFTDVLNSLANMLVSSTAGAHGNFANLTNSGSTVYSGLNSFITNNDPNPGASYPKAYLNWIFLDDQQHLPGINPQYGCTRLIHQHQPEWLYLRLGKQRNPGLGSVL
jgi:hypothetical protein